MAVGSHTPHDAELSFLTKYGGIKLRHLWQFVDEVYNLSCSRKFHNQV